MKIDKDSLVRIGFAAHPHGIKGEVELRLLNDDPQQSILDDGMKLWLFPSGEKSKIKKEGEQWIITKVSFGNKVICKLDGMKDRTHLETLLPFEFYVDRDDFPEPEEDEFYLVDLIDMRVESPEGVELGKLESFSDNGMQYLFDIRLVSGELITLPYVDSFFPEVNTEEEKIIMILPEFSE